MEKNDVYDQKINRRTVFRSSERCSVLSNETTTHGTTRTLYGSTHPLQNENEISSERRRREQKKLTFFNKRWPKSLFFVPFERCHVFSSEAWLNIRTQSAQLSGPYARSPQTENDVPASAAGASGEKIDIFDCKKSEKYINLCL